MLWEGKFSGMYNINCFLLIHSQDFYLQGEVFQTVQVLLHHIKFWIQYLPGSFNIVEGHISINWIIYKTFSEFYSSQHTKIINLLQVNAIWVLWVSLYINHKLFRHGSKVPMGFESMFTRF